MLDVSQANELKLTFRQALRDKGLARELLAVARRRDLLSPTAPWGKKTLKNLKLGMDPRNGDDFHKVLKAGGFQVSDDASDILSSPQFTVVTEETKFDLRAVSIGEVGFNKGATLEQFYDRVKVWGLKKLPLEAGPQLRRQYKGQPDGEHLLVATKPIKDSDGNYKLFVVGRRGSKLCLDTYPVKPGQVLSSVCRFVFWR